MLFRALTGRRKDSWIWIEPPLAWLEDGDIPAEPLIHLIPDKFSLSVFQVDQDQPEQIAQIATALATTRSKLDAVDYILFEENVLQELDIEIDSKAPGDTCDAIVNSWHRDLRNFSANKMLLLAKKILPIVPADFIPKKDIERVFDENCRKNRYNWKYIKLERKDEIKKSYGQ